MASVSDNFNRSGSTLGSNWTTRSYQGNSHDLTTDGSACVPGAENNGCAADYNTAMDSDDHYAEAKMTIDGSDNQMWVTVRRPGTATQTHYEGGYDATSGYYAIRIWVSGSFTGFVGSTYAASAPSGNVVRLTANGSTISLKVDGIQVISGTDTNITSGKYVGLSHYDGGMWDDFAAADLASATTRGTPFGARGTAFNGGRTFMGILR